ncbi:MAG: ABC transporter permease [Bacteroidales bacterium]
MISFLLDPYRRVFAYWSIFWRTTAVEMRTSYAGSVLGLAWMVLGPILLMSIYTLVYTVIFRIRPADMTVADYILHVFSGLLPLLAFSSSITNGATSLSMNKQVLLNTVFPSELVPLRAAVIGAAALPIGLVIVLAAAVVLGKIDPVMLLVPAVLLLQMLFQAGIAWLLALATLVLRDVQHILQYVTIVLLVITPVGYTTDMIPHRLKMLLYFNPLYYFVVAYQDVVVFNRMPETWILLVCLGISGFTFSFGYWVFQRAKLAFYDYI